METYLLETTTGDEFETLVKIFKDFEDMLDRVEKHFHFAEKHSKGTDCTGKKVFSERVVLLVRQDWVEELFAYRTKNFNLSDMTVEQIKKVFNKMILDINYIIGGFFKNSESNYIYIGGSIEWHNIIQCYISNHTELTLIEK